MKPTTPFATIAACCCALLLLCGLLKAASPSEEQRLHISFREITLLDVLPYYEHATGLKAVTATNIPKDLKISFFADGIPKAQAMADLEKSLRVHLGVILTPIPDSKVVSVTYNDQLPKAPISEAILQRVREEKEKAKANPGKIRIIRQ